MKSLGFLVVWIRLRRHYLGSGRCGVYGRRRAPQPEQPPEPKEPDKPSAECSAPSLKPSIRPANQVRAGAASASAAAAPSTTSVTPPASMTRSVATKPIDPSQVTVGMERDEVLARFGEPATRTSQIRRSQMIDTFWYTTTTKDELIVSLTDGKVVSTVLASQRKRTVASTRR